MEITYTNTKIDLLIFSLRTTFRNKVWWILFFIISLGVVVPAIKDLFDEKYKLFIVASIEIVLFMIVMFFGTAIVISICVLVTHAKDRTLNSLKKVCFSKNGILSKTKTSESKFTWQAVTKIEKSNRCIYLYISPIQAFIVPKRVFEINSEFNEAFENITQLFKQHKLENS